MPPVYHKLRAAAVAGCWHLEAPAGTKSFLRICDIFECTAR